MVCLTTWPLCLRVYIFPVWLLLLLPVQSWDCCYCTLLPHKVCCLFPDTVHVGGPGAWELGAFLLSCCLLSQCLNFRS